MSKGTKSFGHDKALACESRGFVCKKRGCVVLTHPHEEGDIHPKYITMWATHYAFQNDPTECQLFFEGLKAGVLDYTKKNNIALNDKEKELTQHPQYNLNIFTISVSKQEDDLTMWRGYGQNGDGISLGFDFSKLPSTLPMYGADCKERKYWSKSEPKYLLYDEIKNVSMLIQITSRLQKKPAIRH